jgi:hypothetical protein
MKFAQPQMKPQRTRAEKSDMLTKYPGRGERAEKKRAHKRRIAEASRKRNRR